MSLVQYNFLHLPERIEFTNTKMILHETGYLSKENGTWKYFYYLKDHVGSNRLVLDDQGGVVQINNFYPYGLTQAEPTPRTDQAEQPYKFGGKELDRDFGVDVYDFEARMYNPAIGRFMQPDPLAEKYYSISPYAYCANNPIRYTDPTGQWILGIDGKAVTYTNGQWSSNASKDVQRVGNAMIGTSTGTERLNYMIGHDEKISITLSSDVVSKDGGYVLGIDNRANQKLYDDGSIVVGEHQITINTGSIEKVIGQAAGDNPYKGLTMDQAIGAIAGHESGHTEKENTKQSYENNHKGANNDVEARPNEIEQKILDELKK